MIRRQINNLSYKLDQEIIKKITPYALVIGITSIVSSIISSNLNSPNLILLIGAISLAIWRAGKYSQKIQSPGVPNNGGILTNTPHDKQPPFENSKDTTKEDKNK